MPSSSLVEAEVGVEVGVGSRLRLGLASRCSSVFLLFWVGEMGWGGVECWRSQI